MNMSSSTRVVTREDRLKLDDTVSVALLKAAQEGRIEVALIRCIAVSVGDHARVDALHLCISQDLVYWTEEVEILVHTVALQCHKSM